MQCSYMYYIITLLSPVGVATCFCVCCLCVFVCLRFYLRNYRPIYVHSTKFCIAYMLPTAVARSLYGGVAMFFFVFPVFWITSCLHITARDRSCEKLCKLIGYSSRVIRQYQHRAYILHRAVYLKLTHQGQHHAGAECGVYDCFVHVTYSRGSVLLAALR